MNVTTGESRETSGAGSETYRIGDLAREFDVTLRTLRFYEDKGLITPQRRGTTRIYSAADRERLKLALFCKRIGLALSEIRAVLEADGEQSEVVQDIYARQAEELQREKARIEDADRELSERRRELKAA